MDDGKSGAASFLVGSDYVFPHAANAIIRDQLAKWRGEVSAEYLLPGAQRAGASTNVVQAIVAASRTDPEHGQRRRELSRSSPRCAGLASRRGRSRRCRSGIRGGGAEQPAARRGGGRLRGVDVLSEASTLLPTMRSSARSNASTRAARDGRPDRHRVRRREALGAAPWRRPGRLRRRRSGT